MELVGATGARLNEPGQGATPPAWERGETYGAGRVLNEPVSGAVFFPDDDAPRPISKAELLKALVTACEQAGGQRAFAAKMAVSPALVSLTLSGAREVGPAILNALGLMPVTMYVPVRRSGGGKRF